MISIISFYIRSLALQLLFDFMSTIVHSLLPCCNVSFYRRAPAVQPFHWSLQQTCATATGGWMGSQGFLQFLFLRGMGDTLSVGKSDFRGKKSSFKFIRGKGQKLSEMARSLKLWAWGIFEICLARWPDTIWHQTLGANPAFLPLPWVDGANYIHKI